MKNNREKVRQLLPQLLLLQKGTGEREANLFEGFKGMITVHEHIYKKLQKGEEYFFIGIPSNQPEHFHSYWEKDHKRRVKSGIKCKLLFHPNTKKEVLENRNKYDGCDARYMPIDIETPAWFMGYKDVSVIGFPSSNPITIEIINQEIADSFKAYFESFWKTTKAYA